MQQLLEYSSWSFQLIMFLVVLYLVIGLIRPSWVLATRRSTIVIVSVVITLIASTAFFIAVQPLDSATDRETAPDLSINETEPAPQP